MDTLASKFLPSHMKLASFILKSGQDAGDIRAMNSRLELELFLQFHRE